MAREITRKTWSSFCRKFNSTNRYRSALLAYTPAKGSSKTLETDLLGINLTKKGRVIDGLSVFAIRHEPESLDQPKLNITGLEKLFVESDADGRDRQLSVVGEDGSSLEINFIGEPLPDGHDLLVEKVAYSLSEHRGFGPGNEQDDWYRAEQVIDQILEELPG